MSDWHRELAREDFDKARTREFLSRLASLLDPARDRLLPFEEVRALLKPIREVYEGIQSVPIDHVIGSEGRYRDFNRHFLPRTERLRTRWVSIDRAHYDEIPLPPVRLYELGGLYFVRDGNHRISVAALRGQTQIDAEITSLGAEARLHPGMTIDELRGEVIAFEKRSFYESTSFAGLTGDENLDFSSPGRYDEILEHITVHKYFINQHGSAELPFWQALVSWYGNVYQPIAGAILETDILPAFPGRTVSDLYVYVVRHWDELKKKSGLSYPLDKAALDFANRFGQPSRSLVLRFLAWLRGRRHREGA